MVDIIDMIAVEIHNVQILMKKFYLLEDLFVINGVLSYFTKILNGHLIKLFEILGKNDVKIN